MRGYLLVLGALLAFCASMVIPDVAWSVMILSVWSGVPLLFATTALAYALCLWPAVRLWPSGWRPRLLGCAASAGLAVALAVLPWYLARNEIRSVMREVGKNDREQKTAIAVRSLEIRHLDSEPCGPECRLLLGGRKVDWVRIIGRETRAPADTVLVLRGDGDCAEGGSPRPAPACIVAMPDHGRQADLVIERDKPRRQPAKGPVHLVGLLETQAIVATSMQGSTPAEVLRRTQADFLAPSLPTVLDPIGIKMSLQTRRVNQASLRAVLVTLGLLEPHAAGVPR